MKLLVFCGGSALCFLFSLPASAQSTGRIDCARDGGYVYLYSSMTTLEVRMTLQCGEVVRVTGRSDDYYSVRTAAGEPGFVPRTSVSLLKDQPGTGLPAPAAKAPARERTHYDEPRNEVAGPARTGTGAFALAKRFLAPLGAMAMRAEEITAERLSERLPVENPDDELGHLARVFNETLARLERSFERLRRWLFQYLSGRGSATQFRQRCSDSQGRGIHGARGRRSAPETRRFRDSENSSDQFSRHHRTKNRTGPLITRSTAEQTFYLVKLE